MTEVQAFDDINIALLPATLKLSGVTSSMSGRQTLLKLWLLESQQLARRCCCCWSGGWLIPYFKSANHWQQQKLSFCRKNWHCFLNNDDMKCFIIVARTIAVKNWWPYCPVKVTQLVAILYLHKWRWSKSTPPQLTPYLAVQARPQVSSFFNETFPDLKSLYKQFICLSFR